MKIPARPPEFDLGVLDTYDGGPGAALMTVSAATDRYLSWEKMRWRTPPSDLTLEQWWMASFVHRRTGSRLLPLQLLSGQLFYALPDSVLRGLDDVAVRGGGAIAMDDPVTSPGTRDRYIVSSLMEEAITSSQLEGASTTRRVAKDMLRSGRAPRTKSEQMIWNNYQAMEFVRDHHLEAVSPALVRELHAIVTHGTLDDPEDAGRLQGPADLRVHVETADGQMLHEPPPAEQLERRLDDLCAFANAGGDDGPYVPAVVRALAVHFMTGYDHYFVDGNGRVARALFYWVMLREGLWLTEFVTISNILKRAPVQYAHSYLNTEYEGDLTFFLDYHLGVLRRAFDELEAYLASKVTEAQDVKRHLRRDAALNHRQIDLVERAVRDAHSEFTVRSHQASHRVSHETARQDLQDLQTRGVLARGKAGRQFVWRPVPDVEEVLRAGSQ